MKSTLNFGYFFMVPGVLLLGAALWLGFRAWSVHHSAARAQGTVTANRIEVDDDGASLYHPEVAFTTPDGERHRFISKVGQTPAGFTVGELVPVAYDPDLPESAGIDTIGQRYFGPIIVAVIGLFPTVGGGILAYSRRKRQPVIL
jgi:hypothetical protein